MDSRDDAVYLMMNLVTVGERGWEYQESDSNDLESLESEFRERLSPAEVDSSEDE